MTIVSARRSADKPRVAVIAYPPSVDTGPGRNAQT
jgi:hypothetical protein